ncbi:hypothetical protein GCM10010191_10980 [Actinomadura vinacea]|uniref:DUF397 domain-containing protein n=1 Tax=Actinomadura vinacea TaxID=115336 RepID=A0ABP5VLS3_9ACTN
MPDDEFGGLLEVDERTPDASARRGDILMLARGTWFDLLSQIKLGAYDL